MLDLIPSQPCGTAHPKLSQFYLLLDGDEKPIYRTTSTDTLELRTTLSATLPRRNLSRPEAPM